VVVFILLAGLFYYLQSRRNGQSFNLFQDESNISSSFLTGGHRRDNKDAMLEMNDYQPPKRII